MRLLLVLAVVAAGAVLLIRGSGARDPGLPGAEATPAPAAEASRDDARAPPRRRPVRRAQCPAAMANCATATGSIVYVEWVDPDGDGDAHYVLAGGRITAPGMSVVDVPRALRPARKPRVGDRVSAAGPVYTGSHGQRQIQAIEVFHRRR